MLTERVGGVAFSLLAMDEAVSYVVGIATEVERRERAPHVHLVNAYSVALASRDDGLSDVYGEESAVVFADGKSVELAHRLVSTHSPGRTLRQVRGPDFFRNVMDRGREVELRHYFLGGTPAALADLGRRVRETYPGIRVVGAYSPPFRSLTSDEISDLDSNIRTSEPQIVWVGLGTPKQDFEAARIARSLGIPAVAVGAAFDYVAGTLTEAPKWMSPLGLEWTFRFYQEPRRLWRRYLIGNLRFVTAVLRHLRPRR